MRGKAAVAAGLLLGGVLAFATACGDDDDDGGASNETEVGTLTLRATDYAFQVEGDLRPGVTRIVMPNEGQFEHYALIFKVEGDHTADEVIDALVTVNDPESPVGAEWPEWAVWKGGPGILSAGETSELIVDFEPGRYVILCPIGEDDPGGDGLPHFAKGMVTEITVTGDAYAGGLPEANLEVNAQDDGTGQSYAFAGVPETLDAGERLIQFTNAGSELHEFILFQIPSDATLDEVLEDEEGAFELVGLGGPGPFGPGDRQQMRVDFEPGRYALVCFLSNPEGIPHVALGMAAQIDVH